MIPTHNTAKGFNLFWNLYQKARQDPLTKKAFFVGWWGMDNYSIDEDDPRFAQYWDGTVDEDEQNKINQVWELYGHQITPPQIAWIRWKGDQTAEASLLDQNFPWTEHDAFLQTGNPFFNTKKIGKIVQHLSDSPPPFRGYAYEFSDTFKETKIHGVRYVEDAQLKVYEEPSPIGSYAMGIDPARGRSENKDRSVVEVYRCYADRIVQVAEFASDEPESFQVAWVMAHLAGSYKNVMMILEISGTGEATFLELKHLRQLLDAGAVPEAGTGNMTDIFGAARWYMYHRSDSPGPGFAYNFSTTQQSKLTIMNQLRDSLTTGLVEVRSIQCALEMQTIVQEGNYIEPAISTDKDDRVFGTAFAHRAWTDWIRGPMIANGETWEREQKREAALADGSESSIVSFAVSQFFDQQARTREEKELAAAWGDDNPDFEDDDDFVEDDFDDE